MASGDTSCMQTDMSQLQHVEEQDPMASGDTSCMQTDMSQLQHVDEQGSVASGDTPCMQTDMSQLQHAEEDSPVNGDRPCRPTCPSCNMMRKTHWLMENTLADRPVLASTMLRKTHWPVDPPVDRQMSQLQQC